MKVLWNLNKAHGVLATMCRGSMFGIKLDDLLHCTYDITFLVVVALTASSQYAADI